MFVLSCKIQILSQTGKQITYNYVSDVKVHTSLDDFTDTCEITVPRKLEYKGKDIKEYVARNDKVEVQLGYDNRLETVFKGYVKRVKTGTPIVIECENEAWKLKQTEVEPVLYDSLTLSDFLKEHMNAYDYQVADANLGEVRIEQKTTLAKVFDYFKKNYPLRFYFREGVFYAGLPSALLAGEQKTIKFRHGLNYVKDQLKYTRAEDLNLQIVAKAIRPDNTKLEWKEPQTAPEANTETYYVPGAKSVDDLKVFAKEKLKEQKTDKMDGTLTAFGEPYVRKGDIAHLLDDQNPERNDKKFIINQVSYEFGQNGYRQKITLGKQL